MESTTIFITGATGVIGRRLVPALVGAGHQVTAVGRTPDARTYLERVGAHAVALDLFDAPAVRRALTQAAARIVINLATHIPSSTFAMLLPWSWKENDRLRRDASTILAGAAHDTGVTRFVQESFAPVYADGGTAWIDETWPLEPVPYNRTVLDAERAATRFTDRGGVGVVLRFAGLYGGDAMLRDMMRVAKMGWAPLPGPPGAYWSSLAQSDAASAVAAALDVPAGAYTVCDDEPVTRRELASIVAHAAGTDRVPRSTPAWLVRLGGKTMALLSRSQRMSNRKFRDASGWGPAWPSAAAGIPAAARHV